MSIEKSLEFSTKSKDLSPKQREMFEKVSQLFIDNIKIGLGGSEKRITGYIDIDGVKYLVEFREVKGDRLREGKLLSVEDAAKLESQYFGNILGDDSTKGTSNHWRELRGEAAEKLFKFYEPLATSRIDFERDQKSQFKEEKMEDKDIKDKLLGE